MKAGVWCAAGARRMVKPVLSMKQLDAKHV
jgi:hypothetical protein